MSGRCAEGIRYQEESRRYFQIQTADNRIMTVCQKETEEAWFLVRMVD